MLRRLLILALLSAAGCSGKNYQVSNPVCGPVPPRYALANDGDSLDEDDPEVQQVSYETQMPLQMTSVVATVNGKPILAGEVLEPLLGKLAEFDAQLAAAVVQGRIKEAERQANLRRAQDMIIQRDLPGLTEHLLMADAVRAKLKKEQLEGINKQLDSMFDKQVEDLKKKLKVETTAELEFQMQKQGMSLETMRKMSADRALAFQYLKSKAGEDPNPTRAELLAVYNSQLEKYARPLQVKWQQLQISIPGSREKSRALEKMDQALEELRGGAAFDDVVKKYSDGPLKNNGGHWDWTQPESVANPDLRKALEKLRAGEMSEVISSPTALQVVKVTDRREAGRQPFEEVHEEIHQQIINEFHEQKTKQIIAEVRAGAVIETIYDHRPADEEDAKK